ncbi:MAG: hypothetical protein KKE71_02275 [Nanoarchaeota archaeon]|nr:hypothetical protein [Nanoarchaeota archaeon]
MNEWKEYLGTIESKLDTSIQMALTKIAPILKEDIESRELKFIKIQTNVNIVDIDGLKNRGKILIHTQDHN